MKIKVRGGAVGMPCDQWCELQQANVTGVHVRLLGDDAPHTIRPFDVVGFMLSDTLHVHFKVASVWSITES